MDDFIESIWEQFGIETEEHVEAIERLLLSQETGLGCEEDLAALFRAFHSLKGLAQAMDLGVMGTVAHRCEDILGLIRSGEAHFDAATAELLLQALDAIKKLLVKAVQERADGEVPADLIRRLEAYYQKLLTKDFEAPTLNDAASIQDEAEMLVFFADHLRAEMPSFVSAIQAIHGLETSSNKALQKNPAEIIECIAYAADVAGVVAMVEVLNELHAQCALKPEAHYDWDAIAHLLREFLDIVLHLEGILAQDAGSSALNSLIESLGADELDSVFQSLFDALHDSRQGAVAPHPDPLPEGEGDLECSLRDFHGHAAIDVLNACLNRLSAVLKPKLSVEQSESLSLLKDVFIRVERDELTFSKALSDLAEQALASLRGFCLKAVPDALEREQFQKDQSQIIESIRVAAWQAQNCEAYEGSAELQKMAEGLGVSPQMAAILSPENAAELSAAKHKGEFLYELSVYLEQPDFADEFLSFVQHQAKLITTRSAFIGDESWYELLLTSALNLNALDEALLVIDPQRRWIKIKALDADNIASNINQAAPLAASKPSMHPVNMIRVSSDVLDRFMAQIGDMVLIHSQLKHVLYRERGHDAWLELKRMAGGQESPLALSDGQLEALDIQQRQLAELETQLHAVLSRLQEGALSLRVVTMEVVFKRLPRVVRDLAQSQGKKVRLEFSGEEVCVDKTMIEVLTDPLLHMVKNAVDHAIESPEERLAAHKPAEAYIRIRAMQQGNRVTVQISDDGRGIDTQKVLAKAVSRGLVHESNSLSKESIFELLFLPGFSTAESITETSGRGVGMDVVRANVLRLGGSIQVKSELGQGSSFSLSLPLSAAVLKALMVGLDQQVYALPERYVAEVIDVSEHEIHSIKGRPAISLRGNFLPLAHLRELLGMEGCRLDFSHVVILADEQNRLGLAIDSILGRQELFVKDLHARLAALPGVGGAAVMGDGRVVLILEADGLFRLAEKLG